MSEVDTHISEILDDVIALRRSIHEYPEPGFEEIETGKKIFAHLEPLSGMSIQTGIAKTGIVATLGREKSGPAVALRADMDCLPIEEETGKPWSSTRPGLMHACGHDGHTACLVGAAIILSRMQDQLKGPVKFFFQPYEEGGGGGKMLCEEGALENPDVAAVFGLHGWPSLKVGNVECNEGPRLAAEDSFQIVVRGKGAHAALPHFGKDPIVAASQIVMNLQTIVSRRSDPLKNLVVTVGRIHGGTASNIIPETVELEGTIRCFDSELRIEAKHLLKEISEKTAVACGMEATVIIHEGYPPLINSDKAAAYVQSIAKKSFGDLQVVCDAPPVMAAEDFAYYCERVPSAFWTLGVCPADQEQYPGLHHPTFDFNDDALPVGMKLHCELALNFWDSF